MIKSAGLCLFSFNAHNAYIQGLFLHDKGTTRDVTFLKSEHKMLEERGKRDIAYVRTVGLKGRHKV